MARIPLFPWDRRNRLTRVTHINNPGTITQAANSRYDAFDRHIHGSVAAPARSALPPNATHGIPPKPRVHDAVRGTGRAREGVCRLVKAGVKAPSRPNQFAANALRLSVKAVKAKMQFSRSAFSSRPSPATRHPPLATRHPLVPDAVRAVKACEG